ncbi:MAG TPA: GMC family oxidoreductase N-terminal domain-containing protein [Stellaceae bacterium]
MIASVLILQALQGGCEGTRLGNLRLHCCRGRIGRRGRCEPTVVRSAQQGVVARSRTGEPSVVSNPDRNGPADRQSRGQLALFLRARGKHTNGRRIPVPRGKLLGGSSSINGMVFVRGQAQDFDTWAQMGNRGWSYAEVLPFFKRMESYAGEGDDAFRGREGPLRVTNPEPRDGSSPRLSRPRRRSVSHTTRIITAPARTASR